MPFKDPEKRREAQRRRRAAGRGTGPTDPPRGITPPDPEAPVGGDPPAAVQPLRLRTPDDVLRALEESLNAVRADLVAGPQVKGRTVAYLLSVGLKAIEVGTLAARVEMLETVLKQRERSA